MTTVTITIDSLTLTASHPVEEANLDVVLNLVDCVLHGHQFDAETLQKALVYDDWKALEGMEP